MLLAILTLLIFLLILSTLVLIHEAGHYFVAKKFGIKVEEFGFGLPPRLWGKKKGETIYSINWLPIGGFVKLYGEDEAGAGRIEVKHEKEEKHKKDESRAFYSRSVGQRAAVVGAGIVMNTFLAVAIYYVFLGISGFKTELPLIGNPHFFFVNEQLKSQLIINSVSKDSPAEKVGLKPASRIISLNGQKMEDVNKFVTIVNQNRGKEVSIEWEDLSTLKQSEGTLVPRVNPPKGQGSLGISFGAAQNVILSYDTTTQKVFSGFIHPANLLVYNFTAMKTLFDLSVQEKNPGPISQGVSGPVGIYSAVNMMLNIPDAKARFLKILDLAGILSISLAFFNLLPIPGLDGGRLFFIIIEGITRKKVNPQIEGYAHAIGMLFLIALILLITIKDITQLFR